jgi:uncharacterized damage-inducible protein DinB
MIQQGRPRSYRLTGSSSFLDSGVSLFDSALGESAERLIDIVAPLSPEQIDLTVGTSRLSIARLVRHIVWAEAQWVAQLAGCAPATELAARYVDGNLAGFGSEPAAANADELCALIRELRYGWSRPALASIAELDAPPPGDPVGSGPRTVREVLMHLLWHWTYHTGQVGLVGELAGSQYVWRFETNTIEGGSVD